MNFLLIGLVVTVLITKSILCHQYDGQGGGGNWGGGNYGGGNWEGPGGGWRGPPDGSPPGWGPQWGPNQGNGWGPPPPPPWSQVPQNQWGQQGPGGQQGSGGQQGQWGQQANVTSTTSNSNSTYLGPPSNSRNATSQGQQNNGAPPNIGASAG